MKKALIGILNDVISLLKVCNWNDQAYWFSQELTKIEVEREGTKEFRATLREIKNRIAGMGSFSDLPMTPRKGSGVSEEEANRKKWELADQLGDTIRAMLKRKRPAAPGRRHPAKGKAK